LLVACVFVAGTASKLMGQDANWDLQNYHFYNPWAWLTGRLYAWDIAAAQLQSYHNPLPDIPFYLMVAADWRPRIIAFVLAIPAGIAAFFLLKLLPLLFRDLSQRERWFATIGAATIGLTSAMGRGVLGSTMNDWVGTALIVAAIWLIVRGLARTPRAPLATGALLASGILCGLATGAKMTFGVFPVGLCVAILLRDPSQRAWVWRAVQEAFVFGVAVLAGTAIAAGPWMWSLWKQFHNPIFPYANGWFKSPWWEASDVLTRVYGPHTFTDWLEFPFRLASPPAGYVAELPYTDVRLPTLYALALLAGVSWLAERIARGTRRIRRAPEAAASMEIWRVVGVFWIVSFALWTDLHSIYRYIIALDLLSGAMIVALLRFLFRPGVVSPAIIVTTAVLVATTTPPDWGRINFAHRWLRVTVPPVEKNALVLLTSDSPMAYVLPFFPQDARHLGINNNISDPTRATLLEYTIAQAIREHRGPLYSLSFPGGSGSGALLAHGVARNPGSCAAVRTNMQTSPIELCRLERIADHERSTRSPVVD
jgi:hypothetical protein